MLLAGLMRGESRAADTMAAWTAVDGVDAVGRPVVAAALCVTALVGTVAVAATDGRVGVAGWVRPGAGGRETAAARR